MSSQRTIRFPRRSLRRPLKAAGASWLVAGLTLVAGPTLVALGPTGSAVAAAPLPGDTPPGGPAPYTLIWTAAHPPSAPPGLQHATAIYDADTSSVVLFGGTTANGTLSNDTWVWDGRTWTEHPAASMTQAPPPRRDASTAFDPALHQLILFGGQGQNGTYLGDTWAWNGAAWYQLAPGPAGSPGARSGASLALGPDGNLVLFGGVGAAAVNSVDSTTSAPPAQSPAGSAGGASATAAPAPGAQVFDDTWQWTSKGWEPTTAAGPSPRWGAPMAYDSANRTTVLFSGNGASPGAAPRVLPGTWAWDGSHWAQQTPSASPPVRFDAVMANDPAAGGVVLTTGNSGAGLLGDGWVWDGSGWAAAQTSGASPREAAAATLDSATSDLLVFGGAGAGGSTLGDTERVATGRPAATTATTVPAPHPTGTGQPLPAATNPPSPTSTPPAARTGTTPPGPSSTTSTTVPQAGAGQQPPSPGGTASVLPYSPTPVNLQTSRHNVRQGSTVRLAGSGFAPGSPVTITFHSAPSLVGRSVAGPQGDFTATVAVPRAARPGEHHFVAAGRSPSGQPVTLVAPVYVLGAAGHTGTSLPVKAGMVALALFIPAGAWLAMSGAGWWRRRDRRSRPSPQP